MKGGLNRAICSLLSFAVALSIGGCVPAEQAKTNSPSGATSWIRGLPIVGGRGLSSSFSGLAAQGDPGSAYEGEGDYRLTASERRMREQSSKFDRTVWEGVLIGAAGGALWGLISGDSTSDVLKKAAIGGAVGGLAGAYIAHKQREYSDKEDQLNSMTADVREYNTHSKKLIASTREVVAEDRRRLAAVERKYRQGAATQSELARERTRSAGNRKVVSAAAGNARKQHGMFEGAKKAYEQEHPEVSTRAFERELETYNEHIETLDSLAQGMAVA